MKKYKVENYIILFDIMRTILWQRYMHSDYYPNNDGTDSAYKACYRLQGEIYAHHNVNWR